MRKYGVASGAALVALCLVSSAQSQNQPAPSGRAAPAQPAAPAPNAPATGTATEPALPNVDDPMLAPPPPAPRVLQSWQEALTLLRQNSTSLATTRARIEQARAQARLALAPALPTLGANASVNHELLRGEREVQQGFVPLPPNNVFAPATRTVSLPGEPTSFRAGLTLRVPLFAPQAWFDHGTALDAVDTSRLDAKEIERQQIAIVANSIVSVVTTERLAEVSRVSLQSALSTLDLNKRRAALGASSMVDVLRAEQEVSASRALVVTTDENLLRAREALGTALGSTDAWGVTNAIRLDALTKDARTSCMPENEIEARPDVRAAHASVEVAERDVRGVDYAFLPTVDGVSSLDWSDPEGANGEHVSWTIGAVLNWTIYDGGVRGGTRNARAAEVLVRREALTDTKRRAQLEVTQAVRGVRVAEANLAVSSRSREIASETARLARIAFLNGSGTSFDLVDTARQLRDAEIDLAIKEFEVLRAKITALLALATCRV